MSLKLVHRILIDIDLFSDVAYGVVLLFFCGLTLYCCLPAVAQNQNVRTALFAGYKVLKINPHATGITITTWDSAHMVHCDPAVKNNKLLLWLTGTGGSTNNVPGPFF